jgi:FkbM family methyltransferase
MRGWLVERLARNSWRIYQALDTSVVVDTLRIPIRHGIGLSHVQLKPYETRLVDLLRSTLPKRAGLIVDVGANIGHFLHIVLLATRTRKYLGAEPSAAGCAYIERLIRANRLDQHSIINCALGDHSGTIEWHSRGSSTDVCASTVPDAYDPGFYTQSTAVTLLTGDALLATHAPDEPVAFIKIDVEGAELSVLRGFEQTIDLYRPLLLVEIFPPHVIVPGEPPPVDVTVQARRQRIDELKKWLAAHGYRAERVRRDGSLLPIVDLDPGDTTAHDEMDHLLLPVDR